MYAGKRLQRKQRTETDVDTSEALAPSYSSDVVHCWFSAENALQKEPASGSTTSKSNQTGMPERLKNGLEQLSGYDLSPVHVNYNSPRPKQLGALAYAQGTNIHLGPGQERHLPHEGWHVVQQMQGRVKPTLQMKSGVSINNDSSLEREADVMGTKSLHNMSETPASRRSSREAAGSVAQLIPEDEAQQLAAVANHIDRMFPIEEGYTLVGMGGSPAPIMAYLESRRLEVFNIPLSLKDLPEKGTPDYDRGQREIKNMLEAIIGDFGNKEKIVLVDVSETGGSIARAIQVIQEAYKDKEIRGVAIKQHRLIGDGTENEGFSNPIAQELYVPDDSRSLLRIVSSEDLQSRRISGGPASGDEDTKEDKKALTEKQLSSRAARIELRSKIREARAKRRAGGEQPSSSPASRSPHRRRKLPRNSPGGKPDFLAKLLGSEYKQYRPVGVFKPMQGDTWQDYHRDENMLRRGDDEIRQSVDNIEGFDEIKKAREKYEALVGYLVNESAWISDGISNSQYGEGGLDALRDRHKQAEDKVADVRIRPILGMAIEQATGAVGEVQVAPEAEEEQEQAARRCCIIL